MLNTHTHKTYSPSSLGHLSVPLPSHMLLLASWGEAGLGGRQILREANPECISQGQVFGSLSLD